MSSSRESPLVRRLRLLATYKLTGGGRSLVLAGLAAAILGTHSLEVPVYLLMVLLLTVGLVLGLANRLLRPACELTGRFPDRGTARREVTGTFRLANPSGRAIRLLGAGFFGVDRLLEDPGRDRVLGVLGPGRSRSLTVALRPRRRGLYPLPPLRVYSTFPFHLFRSGATHRVGSSLLVLPEFHPLEALDIPLGTRYQPGGVALTSDIGESPEYIGNREYRQGDPVRRIDFRGWARLARPVVREYQEEYYCRVGLVLDTHRRLPRGTPMELDPLEAAISLTAAVADALGRGEYLIDLFAAGPELYVFRAGRHTAHLENVLEVLACLEPGPPRPFDILAPALDRELPRIATLIFVLLSWDDHREALVRRAREAGCAVKVMLLGGVGEAAAIAGAEGWLGPIPVLAPEDVAAGRVGRL